MVHVSWILWTVEIVDNAAMLSLSLSLFVCINVYVRVSVCFVCSVCGFLRIMMYLPIVAFHLFLQTHYIRNIAVV